MLYSYSVLVWVLDSEGGWEKNIDGFEHHYWRQMEQRGIQLLLVYKVCFRNLHNLSTLTQPMDLRELLCLELERRMWKRETQNMVDQEEMGEHRRDYRSWCPHQVIVTDGDRRPKLSLWIVCDSKVLSDIMIIYISSN